MPGLHQPFEDALTTAIERAVVALGVGSIIVLAIGSLLMAAEALARKGPEEVRR